MAIRTRARLARAGAAPAAEPEAEGSPGSGRRGWPLGWLLWAGVRAAVADPPDDGRLLEAPRPLWAATNSLRQNLLDQGTLVTAVYVGYIDTTWRVVRRVEDAARGRRGGGSRRRRGRRVRGARRRFRSAGPRRLSAPLSELCPALATPVRCSTGTAWADVCSRPRWQPFTGGRGVLLSWGDVSTLAGGGAYGEQRARPDVAWSA